MQTKDIGHFEILQVIRSKIFRRANGEQQSRTCHLHKRLTRRESRRKCLCDGKGGNVVLNTTL